MHAAPRQHQRPCRRLLPPACDYISSAREDTLYPHLIVQYDQGIRVQVGDINLHAPFPNRLIYVNDPANEALVLSDELGSMLRDADIFLISGFNSMRDQDALDERLFTLRRHMRQLPSDALVYYEDAAFHEPAFSRRVRNALLEVIDVYGLNEDEMQAHLGYRVDLLSVTEVEQALKSLRTLIPAPTLVVHTKYWSLVLGAGASEYAEAVRSGMVMASAHYCYGDDFTDEQHELIRSLPMRPGARAFATALEERMGAVVRCLPGFTLDVAHPTTVGLGDAFVGGFLAALRQVEDKSLMDVILLPSNRRRTAFTGAAGRSRTSGESRLPATASRRTGSHRQRRLLASNRSVSRSCPMAGL